MGSCIDFCVFLTVVVTWLALLIAVAWYVVKILVKIQTRLKKKWQ